MSSVPARRLPVFSLITDSLRYSVSHARALLILALPFLVVQYGLLQFTKPTTEYLPVLSWQYWVVVGVALLAGVVVAVSVHRQFLQSPDRQMPLRWGKAETRYAWGLLKLTLVMIVPSVLYALVLVGILAAVFSNWNIESFGVEQPLLALPLIWLMMLPMLYLWARMTLILPSAAISQQPSVTLSGSMALTKGNGWRMVAVTVAPLLAFGMLDILIQMSLPTVVYWWLQPLIVSVNTVLGVVLVSVSFKQLYDERQLNAESDENGVVAA